ncbi:hypothetical protein PCE1_003227 [Barthelona sp. PCE]
MSESLIKNLISLKRSASMMMEQSYSLLNSNSTVLHKLPTSIEGFLSHEGKNTVAYTTHEGKTDFFCGINTIYDKVQSHITSHKDTNVFFVRGQVGSGITTVARHILPSVIDQCLQKSSVTMCYLSMNALDVPADLFAFCSQADPLAARLRALLLGIHSQILRSVDWQNEPEIGNTENAFSLKNFGLRSPWGKKTIKRAHTSPVLERASSLSVMHTPVSSPMKEVYPAPTVVPDFQNTLRHRRQVPPRLPLSSNVEMSSVVPNPFIDDDPVDEEPTQFEIKSELNLPDNLNLSAESYQLYREFVALFDSIEATLKGPVTIVLDDFEAIWGNMSRTDTIALASVLCQIFSSSNVRFVLSGLSYGLLPLIAMKDELDFGSLLQILLGDVTKLCVVDVPIFSATSSDDVHDMCVLLAAFSGGLNSSIDFKKGGAEIYHKIMAPILLRIDPTIVNYGNIRFAFDSIVCGSIFDETVEYLYATRLSSLSQQFASYLGKKPKDHAMAFVNGLADGIVTAWHVSYLDFSRSAMYSTEGVVSPCTFERLLSKYFDYKKGFLDVWRFERRHSHNELPWSVCALIELLERITCAISASRIDIGEICNVIRCSIFEDEMPSLIDPLRLFFKGKPQLLTYRSEQDAGFVIEEFLSLQQHDVIPADLFVFLYESLCQVLRCSPVHKRSSDCLSLLQIFLGERYFRNERQLFQLLIHAHALFSKDNHYLPDCICMIRFPQGIPRNVGLLDFHEYIHSKGYKSLVHLARMSKNELCAMFHSPVACKKFQSNRTLINFPVKMRKAFEQEEAILWDLYLTSKKDARDVVSDLTALIEKEEKNTMAHPSQ